MALTQTTSHRSTLTTQTLSTTRIDIPRLPNYHLTIQSEESVKDPKLEPKIITSMIAYTAIFLIGITLIAHQEITQLPHQGIAPTIVQIIIKSQAAAILTVGLAITIETGAYIVVLATYLINKKREQAVAEGLAQGQAQAHKRVNEELAAYHARMCAAIDAGEPFNEPPPYFTQSDNED